MLNPGAPPPYHLGVGKLDGPGDLGDFRFDEAAAGRVAQAAGAPGREGAASHSEPQRRRGLSASELNRQLSNPVTSLWSLTFQFNNYRLANDRWNDQPGNSSPCCRSSLTKDWNLITRPVIPLYNIVPFTSSLRAGSRRATGLGDMILLDAALSRELRPRGSSERGRPSSSRRRRPRSPGKASGRPDPAWWSGYLTDRFIVGLFPQQWWSIGGDSDRPATSQLNLQPFAALLLRRRLERRLFGQHPGELEGAPPGMSGPSPSAGRSARW